MIKGSVGTVTTQYYHHPSALVLESGEKLPSLSIAYETYGKLNRDKSNAILICHALSGDAHVAGFYDGEDKPGWWDAVVGPGNDVRRVANRVRGGKAGRCAGDDGIDMASIINLARAPSQGRCAHAREVGRSVCGIKAPGCGTGGLLGQGGKQ